MIPEKIPQDFYSRPTDKRIEWWNLFLQSLSETIKDILKKITNKDTVMIDDVQKKLYFKTITGTTSAGATASSAHGLDITKILFCTSKVYNANGYTYLRNYPGGEVSLDATYFYLDYTADLNFGNQSYIVTIAYYE